MIDGLNEEFCFWRYAEIYGEFSVSAIDYYHCFSSQAGIRS